MKGREGGVLVWGEYQGRMGERVCMGARGFCAAALLDAVVCAAHKRSLQPHVLQLWDGMSRDPCPCWLMAAAAPDLTSGSCLCRQVQQPAVTACLWLHSRGRPGRCSSSWPEPQQPGAWCWTWCGKWWRPASGEAACRGHAAAGATLLEPDVAGIRQQRLGTGRPLSRSGLPRQPRL